MNQELKSNQLIKRQQALFDQIIEKYGDQFHSICLDKAQKGSSTENCVVFGLPKKKPLSELKDSEVLPTEIDVPGIGVMKVDVQETRIVTLDGNLIDGYLNQGGNSSIDQFKDQASLSKNYPHYMLDGFLDPSSGVNYSISPKTMAHAEESPRAVENWKNAEVNQTEDGSLLWTQIYTRCAAEDLRDITPQNQKNDHIKSGIVIGAEGMEGAVGTLGALVVDKDDNSLCALTNGHVVSKNLFVTNKRVGEYSANILGKKVYHGDLVQQNRDAWTEDDQIGIVKKSVPLGIIGTDTSADLFTAEDVACDAALIAIKASKVNIDSWKLAGDDANPLMNQAAKFMDADDFSFFLEDSIAYNYISDVGGGKKDEPLMVFSGRSSGFHNSHENNNRIRNLGPAYGVKVAYSQGGVIKYLWIRGAFVIADQDWDLRYSTTLDNIEDPENSQVSEGSLFCQNTIMSGDSGSVIYAYTNTFVRNSDGSPHKLIVPQDEAILKELNRTADVNGKWTKTLTEVMQDLGIGATTSHTYYDFGPHVAQKVDTSSLSESSVLAALKAQTLDPDGNKGTEKHWRIAGQAFAAEIVTQQIINEEGEDEIIQYSTRGFCQPMHRIANLLNIKEWDGNLNNVNYNVREDNSYVESLVFSKGLSDVYNISLNQKNYYQAGGIAKAEGREYTAAIEAKTNLTKSNYPFDETMPPLSEWMTFDSFDIEVAEGGSVQSGLNNPRKYPIWLKLNNLSIDLSKLPEEVLRMPTGAMHMDAVLMDANAVFNVEDWYTDTKLSGMPDQGLFYHGENSTTKAYASWRIFSRAGEIASKDTVSKSYPLYLKEFDGKTKFKGYQIKFPLGGGIGYNFDLDQNSQTYSFNKEKTGLSVYFQYLPWTISGNSISFNATPGDIESWLGTKPLKLVFVLWKNDTFDAGTSTRIGRSVNFRRKTQSYLIQTTAIADDITSADLVSYTPGLQESDDKLSRYESLDLAQRKLRILFDSDHLGGPNPNKGIKDSNGLNVGNKFKCQQIKLSESAGKYTYKFETTPIATKGFQELMPGAVLTIDWSDAPDHPVGISTTNDGTHGGGDLYSEVEIDLATKTTKCYFKMADTLGGENYSPDPQNPGLKEFRTTTKLDFYVYCTNHPGMGFPLQFIDIQDGHKELYINSWMPKKIFLPINHVGPGGATILWNSLDRSSDVLPVVNLEPNTKFSARQMYWTANAAGFSSYNGWRHPYNPWRDNWSLESSDANLAKCLAYGDCEDLQEGERTIYVDDADLEIDDDYYTNQVKFNLHGRGWEANDKVNDLTYSLDNQWIILEENKIQRGDVFEVVVLGDVKSFGLHEDWFNENNELKSFSRNKDKWAKNYLAAYKSSFSFGIKNISYPSWIDCKWYHTFDGSSIDTISGLNKPISNPSVMVNTFANLVNILDHRSFNIALSDFSNAEIMEQIFANSRISSDLQKIVFDSNYQITNGIAENLAELAERSGCQLEIKQANLAKYNAKFDEFAIVERALDPTDTTVIFAESSVDFEVGVEIRFLKDKTFENGDIITAGSVVGISAYTEGSLNFQINYLEAARNISTSELDDLYEFVNGDKPVLYFNGTSLPTLDLQQRLLAAGVVAHIGRSSSLGKIKDLTKYFAGQTVNSEDLNYLIRLINQRGIDKNADFTKFCYNANVPNLDLSSIQLESPDFTKMFQGSIISGLKLPKVLNSAYSVKDMFESSTITANLDLEGIVDVGTKSVESCFYNTTTSFPIDITSWKFSEIKLFEYMDEFIINSYLNDFKVSQVSKTILLNSADFWFKSLNITNVRKVGRSTYRTYEDTTNGLYIPYEDDTEWNNFNQILVAFGEEDITDPDFFMKPAGKIYASWFEMDHSPNYNTWSWRNDGGQDSYDFNGSWDVGKSLIVNLPYDDNDTNYDDAISGFGYFSYEEEENEWNHLNGIPTNTYSTRSTHLRLNQETDKFEIVNAYKNIVTVISDAGNYTGGFNGTFSPTPDLFQDGKGIQKYITQTNGLEVFTSHIKMELSDGNIDDPTPLDVYRLSFFVHLGKYYNSESKLFSYNKYKGAYGKFPLVIFKFEKRSADFTEAEKLEIYNYIETLNIKDYAVSPTNPRYAITNKTYANQSPFLFGPKIADKYLTISEQLSDTGDAGRPARFHSKNVSLGEGGGGDVEVYDVKTKSYPYNLLSENKLTEKDEVHIPVPFVEYNNWNHATQYDHSYPLMLRWQGVEEDIHLRFLGNYIQQMGGNPMFDFSIKNKNVKSEPAQIYIIADGTEVLGERYYITDGSQVQAIELEEQNILILVLGIEVLDVNAVESNQITQRLEAWVDDMLTITQPFPEMDPSYFDIDYSNLENTLRDAINSTNNFEIFFAGWNVTNRQQVSLTLFYPKWSADFNAGTSPLSSLSLYKDADRTIPADSVMNYVIGGSTQYLIRLYYKWSYSYDTQDFVRPGSLIVLDSSTANITYTTNTTNNSTTTITPSNICMVVKVDKDNIYFVKTGDTVDVGGDSINYGVHDNNDFSGFAFKAPNAGMSPTVDLIITGGTAEEPTYARHLEYPSLPRGERNTTFHKITPRIMHVDQSWTSVTNRGWEENKLYFTAQKTNGETSDGVIVFHPIREGEDEGKLIDKYPIGETEKLLGVKGTYALYIDGDDFKDTEFYQAELESEYESVIDIPAIDSSKYEEYPAPKSNLGHYKGGFGSKWVIMSYDPLQDGFTKIRGKYTEGNDEVLSSAPFQKFNHIIGLVPNGEYNDPYDPGTDSFRDSLDSDFDGYPDIIDPAPFDQSVPGNTIITLEYYDSGEYQNAYASFGLGSYKGEFATSSRMDSDVHTINMFNDDPSNITQMYNWNAGTNQVTIALVAGDLELQEDWENMALPSPTSEVEYIQTNDGFGIPNGVSINWGDGDVTDANVNNADSYVEETKELNEQIGPRDSWKYNGTYRIYFFKHIYQDAGDKTVTITGPLKHFTIMADDIGQIGTDERDNARYLGLVSKNLLNNSEYLNWTESNFRIKGMSVIGGADTLSLGSPFYSIFPRDFFDSDRDEVIEAHVDEISWISEPILYQHARPSVWTLPSDITFRSYIWETNWGGTSQEGVSNDYIDQTWHANNYKFSSYFINDLGVPAGLTNNQWRETFYQGEISDSAITLPTPLPIMTSLLSTYPYGSEADRYSNGDLQSIWVKNQSHLPQSDFFDWDESSAVVAGDMIGCLGQELSLTPQILIDNISDNNEEFLEKIKDAVGSGNTHNLETEFGYLYYEMHIDRNKKAPDGILKDENGQTTNTMTALGLESATETDYIDFDGTQTNGTYLAYGNQQFLSDLKYHYFKESDKTLKSVDHKYDRFRVLWLPSIGDQEKITVTLTGDGTSNVATLFEAAAASQVYENSDIKSTVPSQISGHNPLFSVPVIYSSIILPSDWTWELELKIDLYLNEKHMFKTRKLINGNHVETKTCPSETWIVLERNNTEITVVPNNLKSIFNKNESHLKNDSLHQRVMTQTEGLNSTAFAGQDQFYNLLESHERSSNEDYGHATDGSFVLNHDISSLPLVHLLSSHNHTDFRQWNNTSSNPISNFVTWNDNPVLLNNIHYISFGYGLLNWFNETRSAPTRDTEISALAWNKLKADGNVPSSLSYSYESIGYADSTTYQAGEHPLNGSFEGLIRNDLNLGKKIVKYHNYGNPHTGFGVFFNQTRKEVVDWSWGSYTAQNKHIDGTTNHIATNYISSVGMFEPILTSRHTAGLRNRFVPNSKVYNEIQNPFFDPSILSEDKIVVARAEIIQPSYSWQDPPSEWADVSATLKYLDIIDRYKNEEGVMKLLEDAHAAGVYFDGRRSKIDSSPYVRLGGGHQFTFKDLIKDASIETKPQLIKITKTWTGTGTEPVDYGASQIAVPLGLIEGGSKIVLGILQQDVAAGLIINDGVIGSYHLTNNLFNLTPSMRRTNWDVYDPSYYLHLDGISVIVVFNVSDRGDIWEVYKEDLYEWNVSYIDSKKPLKLKLKLSERGSFWEKTKPKHHDPEITNTNQTRKYFGLDCSQSMKVLAPTLSASNRYNENEYIQDYTWSNVSADLSSITLPAKSSNNDGDQAHYTMNYMISAGQGNLIPAGAFNSYGCNDMVTLKDELRSNNPIPFRSNSYTFSSLGYNKRNDGYLYNYPFEQRIFIGYQGLNFNGAAGYNNIKTGLPPFFVGRFPARKISELQGTSVIFRCQSASETGKFVQKPLSIVERISHKNQIAIGASNKNSLNTNYNDYNLSNFSESLMFFADDLSNPSNSGIGSGLNKKNKVEYVDLSKMVIFNGASRMLGGFFNNLIIDDIDLSSIDITNNSITTPCIEGAQIKNLKYFTINDDNLSPEALLGSKLDMVSKLEELHTNLNKPSSINIEDRYWYKILRPHLRGDKSWGIDTNSFIFGSTTVYRGTPPVYVDGKATYPYQPEMGQLYKHSKDAYGYISGYAYYNYLGLVIMDAGPLNFYSGDWSKGDVVWMGMSVAEDIDESGELYIEGSNLPGGKIILKKKGSADAVSHGGQTYTYTTIAPEVEHSLSNYNYNWTNPNNRRFRFTNQFIKMDFDLQDDVELKCDYTHYQNKSLTQIIDELPKKYYKDGEYYYDFEKARKMMPFLLYRMICTDQLHSARGSQESNSDTGIPTEAAMLTNQKTMRSFGTICASEFSSLENLDMSSVKARYAGIHNLSAHGINLKKGVDLDIGWMKYLPKFGGNPAYNRRMGHPLTFNIDCYVNSQSTFLDWMESFEKLKDSEIEMPSWFLGFRNKAYTDKFYDFMSTAGTVQGYSSYSNTAWSKSLFFLSDFENGDNVQIPLPNHLNVTITNYDFVSERGAGYKYSLLFNYEPIILKSFMDNDSWPNSLDYIKDARNKLGISSSYTVSRPILNPGHATVHYYGWATRLLFQK